MIQMLPSQLFRDLVMRMGGRMLLIFLLLAGAAAAVLALHRRKQQQVVDPWAARADKAKTPEEDLAAVQGPDLLEVHKKANMTVSARRKLNEKLKKEKQAIGTPDEAVAAEFRDAALDAPVESRQRIEFAPIDEASARQAEEKDDDYDELL